MTETRIAWWAKDNNVIELRKCKVGGCSRMATRRTYFYCKDHSGWLGREAKKGT